MVPLKLKPNHLLSVPLRDPKRLRALTPGDIRDVLEITLRTARRHAATLEQAADPALLKKMIFKGIEAWGSKG